MTRKIAIEIRDIRKDFQVGEQKIRVLHDVNLNIYSGELTMIVGPSGCGKTTLLSIITGILTPSQGSVKINDCEITKLKGAQKVNHRRKNLGFIFQQYNLLPALTAAENAAIPLIADGMKNADAIAKARQVLKDIDMADHLEKLPSQLSGGQQQRVAIARALVHEPLLIVCDEPTSALDAATGQKVMETLRKSALEKGRAVIVVTHDNRIFKFADRLIEMEDGKVTASKVRKKKL
jgi:putative ABC transport system ATP-binding protein